MKVAQTQRGTTVSPHHATSLSIQAELLRVEPEIQRIELGSHSVYRFETVTPAHTFVSIIKLRDSGSIIQLTARDSFAERLALHLLDHTDKLECDDRASDSVRVQPTECPHPWKFDTIVVVPPPIAKRFEHQSEILTGATFWVVPAFSGEFKDGDNGKTFSHQLGRKDGWRVHVIDWSREFKKERKWD
jgi:hypothetical protein